jgi:hypothetical protein
MLLKNYRYRYVINLSYFVKIEQIYDPEKFIPDPGFVGQKGAGTQTLL